MSEFLLLHCADCEDKAEMNRWNVYVQLLPSFTTCSLVQSWLSASAHARSAGISPTCWFYLHHHRLSFPPVVPPPFHLISDTYNLPLNLLTSRLFCVSPSPCVRPSGCSYIFFCVCAEFKFWFILFFFLLSSCMFVSLMSHRSHTLLCPILVFSFVSFLLKPFQRVCCNIFAALLFLE